MLMKIIKFNHIGALVVSLLLIAGCGATGELTLIESSGVKAVSVTCDGGPCDAGDISATAEICVTVQPKDVDLSTLSLSLTCAGRSYEIPEPAITEGSDGMVLCYKDYEQPPQVTTCTIAVNEVPSASASVAKADQAPVYTVDVKTKCGSYDDFTNEATLEKCWYAMLCRIDRSAGGGVIINPAVNAAKTCITSWDLDYVDPLTGQGSGWDEIKRYINFEYVTGGLKITPNAAFTSLVANDKNPYFLHIFKSFDNMDIKAKADISYANLKHGLEDFVGGGPAKPGPADGVGVGFFDNMDADSSCASNVIGISTGIETFIPDSKPLTLLLTAMMNGNMKVDGVTINQEFWTKVAEHNNMAMNNPDAMNQLKKFMLVLHNLNDWVGHRWMDINLNFIGNNVGLGTICGIDFDSPLYDEQLQEWAGDIKMALVDDFTEEMDLWNVPAFPEGIVSLWMEMVGGSLKSSFDVGYGRTDFGKSYVYNINLGNNAPELVSVDPLSVWFDEASGQNFGITFIPAVAAAAQRNIFQAQNFSINVGKGPISIDEPALPADTSTYPTITVGPVYICPGGDGAIPKAIDFTNGYSGKYFDRTPARFCQ